MTAQTSYTINQRVSFPGVVYAQFPHDIESRACEDAAGIAFGVVVSRGTDADKQATAGGATGVLGITIRDLGREGAANTGAVSYSQNETMAIMRSGYIYATCPSGCVPGDAVNYTTATGVLDSGAPGGGETALANATWESTTAAGEIGILRVKG